jgi:OOP family OmpA-OmpF porin
MSKSLVLTALCVALFAPSAHAQQAYAGAALGSNGTFRHQAGPGKPQVDDHVLFGKLYGGYAFNDTFALEGGWATFGEAEFASTETGAPFDRSFKVNLVYAAVRASHRFNDAWSVSAKLGAARHFHRLDTGSEVRRAHDLRPMFGLGASYDLTPNAALTLEFNHYGTARTEDSTVRVRKLEAGVKFSF